jgi:hypothetical protein
MRENLSRKRTKVGRLTLGILALLVAATLCSFPFIASFLYGLAMRRRWVAYLLGFATATGITLLSAARPETFHVGTLDLGIHDRLFLAGVPALFANVAMNLVFAAIGTLAGFAAREGWREGSAGSEPGHLP